MVGSRRWWIATGMFALIMMSFIYMQVFTPYHFRVVLSDSNAPEDNTGDMVLVNQHVVPSELKIGQVLIYYNPTDKVDVIHRIYNIWIDPSNNATYVAMKGIFNSQPDIADPIPNLIINRNITFLFNTQDGSFNFPQAHNATIIISYFNVKAYVIGIVDARIPILGWVFLPFFSPLQSILIPWVAITFFYAIGSLIYMVYTTNKKFEQIIQMVANGITHWYGNTKIQVKNYYSILFGSAIIFILVIVYFFLILSSGFTAQIAITTTLTQDHYTNFSNGSQYAIWNEQIDLTSPTTINHNSTQIYITWLPNSTNNYLYLSVNETGQKIVTDVSNNIHYSQIENYTYIIKVLSNNYQVIAISGYPNPSRNLVGHFLPWLVSFTKSGTNSIYGLRIRDLYRAAYAGTYNNTPVWTTNLTFTGIEQLIAFNVYEQADVAQNSGLLIYYHLTQTENLWLIPELIYLFMPAIIFSPLYYWLQHKLQRQLNARLNVLTRSSQEQTINDLQSTNNTKLSNMIIENEYFREPSNKTNDDDKNNDDLRKNDHQEREE